MPELSPAAHAIARAFDDRFALCGPFDDGWHEYCLAAALEALADQVVPVLGRSPEDSREDERLCVRDEILDIAFELRGGAND